MGRWQTIVEMLNRESNSQAGVFSLDGTRLAATRELSLHSRSAAALVTSFRDTSGALFGIHVGQDLFKCYRAGERVMIGKACGAYNDNRMFAAMLTEECLIFCMLNMASTSTGEHRGSVLGVMQAALSKSKSPAPAPARQLPLDCRVEVSSEDLPLIDLEIR